MMPLVKYPRTQHLEGSRLQPGDHDLNQVHLAEISDKYVVIEEKLDGANSAISFHPSGQMLIQSRGHYLTGGERERHFDPLKQWAATMRDALWPVLGSRYIVFGEWLWAKHTIFYDALPHFFLEFDIYDRETCAYLSTERRKAILAGTAIASVPILASGSIDNPVTLICRSTYKTGCWRDRLRAQCERLRLNPDTALRETDQSDLMEGLYIKWEEGDVVKGRYKYVRSSFLDAVAESGSHWLSRPIIPNLLASDGLFA